MSRLLKGENHVKRASLEVPAGVQAHMRSNPLDLNGYLGAVKFFADVVNYSCAYTPQTVFPHDLWEVGSCSVQTNQFNIRRIMGFIASGHRITGFVKELELRPGLEVSVYGEAKNLLLKIQVIFWHTGEVATLLVEHPWKTHRPR